MNGTCWLSAGISRPVSSTDLTLYVHPKKLSQKIGLFVQGSQILFLSSSLLSVASRIHCLDSLFAF